MQLLKEVHELLALSRQTLSNTAMNQDTQQNLKGTKTNMSTPSATQAAELYTSGKSVVEVAQELGITYGKARKLIADSGTEIRNTSDRLKGKTRKSK